MSTNLEIAFNKINASTLTSPTKQKLKQAASKHPGIAEGIKLEEPCSDSFLEGLIGEEGWFSYFLRILFGVPTSISSKTSIEDNGTIAHELTQLRKMMHAHLSGSVVISPVSDAGMFRMEVGKDFSIPTYDHYNPPGWIGDYIENDAVLPVPLVYAGNTESDLVRAMYPVLANILSNETIKLVNSETDVFLPVPGLFDEADLYNKPDLHLIHPALYCQSKPTVNDMIFGKPDVNCLNGIIALLEAKLPPLSDTQVGVLMRYLTYWFKSVNRNVSGIVFNKDEFVYCDMAYGCFNTERFIRCRWNAAGSKGLLKKLLVDFAVKPTEAMVISELCKKLKVRLSTVPGTSYLGRGAEATVLKVTDIKGETDRALKYYHGEQHIRQCHVMCTHTNDLIRRVPKAAELVIAHIGQPVSVIVDEKYRASGVLIESVGTPVSVNDFVSRKSKLSLLAHLRALHTIGVVHGDARIQNIVVIKNADKNVLKWIDLGRTSEFSADLAAADFATLMESIKSTKYNFSERSDFAVYAKNPSNDLNYSEFVGYIMTLF